MSWSLILVRHCRSSIPRKRQKRDSGSITEPEVAIKDFAKNLKDESDVNSITQQTAADQVTKTEPPQLDEQDESNASNSMDRGSLGGSMGAAGAPNLNPGSFLGMAAASLMDPSAAKGTYISCQIRINPVLILFSGFQSFGDILASIRQ